MCVPLESVLGQNVFKVSDPVLFLDYDMGSLSHLKVFWIKMFSKCQIRSCFWIMTWAVFVLLRNVFGSKCFQNVRSSLGLGLWHGQCLCRLKVFWLKMFSKCWIQSCFWIMTWAVFVLLKNVFRVSDPTLFLDYDTCKCLCCLKLWKCFGSKCFWRIRSNLVLGLWHVQAFVLLESVLDQNVFDTSDPILFLDYDMCTHL